MVHEAHLWFDYLTLTFRRLAILSDRDSWASAGLAPGGAAIDKLEGV